MIHLNQIHLSYYILLIASCALIKSEKDIDIVGKWVTYDKSSNPPYDPYIYMNGPYNSMQIKFIKPKSKLILERLSIQFNYWAHWNRSHFPPNERSTELFQLSVITCNHSAPQVKYVGFNKSFTQWETYSNMIAENLEECDEEIIIKIIDNKVNYDKINKDSTYKIAIKAIEIKLKYKNIALQTYYCSSKDNCNEKYFILNGHRWSPKNLPPMENFNGYYYTKENKNDLIINLNNSINKCIDINYYTVHDTILLMKIIDDGELNHCEIQLSSIRNKNSEDEIYGWHQMTLCPSKITLSIKEKIEIIFSIANNSISNDTLAAIAFLREDDAKIKNISNKPVEFLRHWKRGGKYSWYPLNDYFTNDYKQYWSYNNYTNHESFIMSTEPRTSGIGYLYSDWFEFYDDLKFAYLIESNLESELKINASLLIMENNLNIVDIIPLKITNKEENFILPCEKCEIGWKYFLMIKIEYYSPSSKSSKQVTIKNVYLSDACEDGSKCLNTNKECINLGRNDYKCPCTNDFWGKNCEYINYCSNGGYSFCEKRNGKCEKEYYEPKKRICKCDAYNYWNYDEKKCEQLDRCIGISHFCHGYQCNEHYVNVTDICLECDNEHVKVDNVCKKIDPCDNNCQNAKCQLINNKPYCYCEKGIWSEITKSCITNDSCTPWDKQKNKCDQDCKRENNEIICDCLPGYILDNNVCIPQFSCNDLVCSQPSICSQKNDSKECVCPNGYSMNGTQCIDICTLAKNGEKSAQATVFKNCESYNCIINKGLFQCICELPLSIDKYGMCKFEKSCLFGNKGYQKCSKLNALCRPRGTADKNGDFYECYCPEGKKMVKNICVDECEIENKCLAKNAICRYSFSKKQNECICRPGFNNIRHNSKCYLSKKASKWQFVMKLLRFNTRLFDQKNYYTDVMDSLCSKMSYTFKLECLRYIQEIEKINYEYEMKRQLHYELEYFINNNSQSKRTNHIFLIDYKILDEDGANNDIFGKDYLVTVSSSDENLNFNCTVEFDEDDKRHDYCLLPPKILIKRNETINKFPLLPCEEKTIDYCSKNTNCTALVDHHYRCDCLDGYKTDSYIELSRTNMNALKAHCVLNEGCKNKECGENARCISVLDQDYCECNAGFKYNESGYCIDICSELDCIHGTCYLLNNNTGICRCHGIYTGISCDKINSEIAILRVYLIAASLFILILMLIILGRYFNKKRKVEQPDASNYNGVCNYYTQTKF